jgi:hypothetical protein
MIRLLFLSLLLPFICNQLVAQTDSIKGYGDFNFGETKQLATSRLKNAYIYILIR